MCRCVRVCRDRKRHRSHPEGSESTGTSSAPPSTSTSVTTTPRQLPALPGALFPDPLPRSMPTTPRFRDQHPQLGLSATATSPKGQAQDVGPTQCPDARKRFIGPQISPLLRPSRPEHKVGDTAKESEFFKLLSSRRPAPVAVSTCPTTLPVDANACYNQWGERVQNFIGPLPSPGSTPILSFTSPTPRMASDSPCTLSVKSTPRKGGAQPYADQACQCPPGCTHEFACRGVAALHSPLCIYSESPEGEANDMLPPALKL